jgi:hypothetical protein
MVWYGDKCETEVQLRNAGSAPLHIQEVKSSCGCTAAKPKKDMLAPGEADTLHISYDTKKGAKKVYQNITLVTDDPTEPRITISVQGEVRHIYDMTPNERVSFNQITQTVVRSETMELHSNVPEKVTLRLAPLPPNARFAATLNEVEPGKTYKLEVSTRPPLEKGYNAMNLTLETSHAKYPTIGIPVSAYALDRVAVVPEKILVLAQSPAARVQTLRVNFLPDQPIAVQSVKSDSPLVQVEALPQRERPDQLGMFSYQIIRVTLPAYASMPDAGATVTIVTNDPDPQFQTIVVPIEKHKPYTATSAPAQAH